MIIENLEQYNSKKREIKKLEIQISDLESAEDYSGKSYFDVASGSSANFPYMKRNFVIEAVDKTSYYEKLKKLKIRLDERKKEVTEIEAFIDSINDSDIWQIIQYKYVDDLSWLSVAMKICDYPCADKLRMKLKRFLEKN